MCEQMKSSTERIRKINFSWVRCFIKGSKTKEIGLMQLVTRVNGGKAADRPFSKLHSHSVSCAVIHHSHTASRSVNKCEFKSEKEVKKKKRYTFVMRFSF